MRSTEEASQAAVNGDRKALEEVVRVLLPRVGNPVRNLVRGRAKVDDIAQEALVAAITGRSSLRGLSMVPAPESPPGEYAARTAAQR